MGELLLSLLDINDANQLVFKSVLPYSKYERGSLVPICYPHKTKERPYYRVLGKSYVQKALHDLVLTQDPNFVDGDFFTAYQREKRDESIYTRVNQGEDMLDIAEEMRWHKQAVVAAIARHFARKANPKKLDLLAGWED